VREPGFIAVVRKADALTVDQQGRNAVAAGAAVVIMNDPAQAFPTDYFSPNDPFPWPFGLAVSYEEGMHLLRYAGQPASSREVCCDYSPAFGTSFSAPHVAGLAALLRSIVPYATAKEISSAIIDIARDIDAPGIDLRSGHGLVDGLAASGNSRWTSPSRGDAA
jgi:subtilisin family serine protease